MKNLQVLYLSKNNIHGRIPDWAQEIGGNGLLSLDLSNNFITGLPQFQCDGLELLFLQTNQIQGPFSPSICNMRNLEYLDISDNSFSGVIPQCLGNTSSILRMVDMGNNHFHGTIPNLYDECGRLEGLIFNGNRLQGEVPSSLSKCQSLKALDLGKNQLNGTFPHWLGDLPKLQVLVLKSNNLHGVTETSYTNKSAFPSIRILDLSHNGFVGNLPRKYFQNFNAMKNVRKNNTQPEYLIVGKYYSMTIAVKGVEQVFPKLFLGYTIVDLSRNRFEGEISGVIGHLASLKVLNLSHNSLTGQIPNALGNLLEIESLDLSYNQLKGDIPQSLADITGLEVLNLSQNNLVGRIPHGAQFNTFSTSFEGNPKLCGFPLLKKCEHTLETQVGVHGDEDGCGDDGVWVWDLTWISDGVSHVVNRKTKVVQCNCSSRRAHDLHKTKHDKIMYILENEFSF